MADTIFPSENDVGTVTGAGNTPTEGNLTKLSDTFGDSRYKDDQRVGAGGVLSGFGFSSGSATSVTLTSGTAVIRGHHVTEDTSISGTLTASTFNYVFLALTKSGGLVTGIELQVRTAATFDTALASVPDDSILLFVFETDGSSIVNQYDLRTHPSDAVVGMYIGDNASTRTFNLGFRPKMVQIQRFTTPRFVAFSEMPNPRPSEATNYGLYAFERTDGAGCAVGLANDRTIRPRLEANGFSVDASAGSIAPGGILRAVDASYDPPSINNGTTHTRAVTVTGALVGDVAIANHATAAALLLNIKAVVTGADTVTVYFTNTSGAAINPSASDLIVAVICQGGTPNAYRLNEISAVYVFTAWY